MVVNSILQFDVFVDVARLLKTAANLGKRIARIPYIITMNKHSTTHVDERWGR